MAPAAAKSASPIGIANLPNQRHKIVAKRGAAFTIMVRFTVQSLLNLVLFVKPMLTAWMDRLLLRIGRASVCVEMGSLVSRAGGVEGGVGSSVLVVEIRVAMIGTFSL